MPSLPSELVTLLYEDDCCLVVDKPSGLASHRGWAAEKDTLASRLRQLRGGPIHLVHRLDRGTSGALLVAKSRDLAVNFQNAMATHELRKSYLALVRGRGPSDQLLDHPVPQTEDGPRIDAQTQFYFYGSSPVERCSLVEAQPQTGRLHQIRRHLKHLTHPLVGDVNYGKGDINRLYREKYGFFRLALHAWRLFVPTPACPEPVEVTAPIPEAFLLLLQQLELAAPLPHAWYQRA